VDILDRTETGLAYPPNKSTGQPKWEKWKWAKLAPFVGEFRRVPKTALHLDGDYQRDAVSKARVVAIAAEFDWLRFGALAVAERGDKTLWVVDGGHRLRAAMKRVDVTLVPCVVHPSNGVAHEAEKFVDINTAVSWVRPHQRHKAGVVAGLEPFVTTERLLHKAGYHVSRSPGELWGIRSIGVLNNCVVRDVELAEVMLKLLAIIEPGGEQPTSDVLKGLFQVLIHFGRDAIMTKRNIRVLTVAGFAGITAQQARDKIIAGKGGEKVLGQSIATIINKGLRNRLEW